MDGQLQVSQYIQFAGEVDSNWPTEGVLVPVGYPDFSVDDHTFANRQSHGQRKLDISEPEAVANRGVGSIPSHFLSTLTKLELHNRNLPVAHLIRALHCAPNLVNLILDGWGLGPKATVDVVSLLRLTSLTLEVINGELGVTSNIIVGVERLSRCLRIPALQSFHLRFKYEKLEKFSYTSKVAFFPCDVSMPNLCELSFSLLVESPEGHLYLSDQQKNVDSFVDALLSQFTTVEIFNLRASQYTNAIELLDNDLYHRLRRFHVYGGYETLAFLPKAIDALKRAERSNLQEIWLHIRRDLDDECDEEFEAERMQSRFWETWETKFVLEQVVNGATITVLHTLESE